MADTFQCAKCRGVFEKGWTDEEANAESTAVWGALTRAPEDTAVICDVCYREMMGLAPGRPDQRQCRAGGDERSGMIALFAREVGDLIWYFEDCDGDEKRDVQSAESRWEAELEARSKMRRHRGFITEDDRGLLHCIGTDLGCGCSAHGGTGSEGGRKQSHGVNPLALMAVRAANVIETALQRADDSVPYLRDPPWTCPALPSHLLRLRFREPLSMEFAMFDPAAARVHATLKMMGSGRKLERERARLATLAARAKPERGAGNLAPYTATAIAEFRSAKTEAERLLRVRALGRRLARPVATIYDRGLQREIAHEVELLETATLSVYRRAANRRLPGRVRRVGIARVG